MVYKYNGLPITNTGVASIDNEAIVRPLSGDVSPAERGHWTVS